MQAKKDKGFTLIELMIVFSVIGILAVSLIPKIESVKTMAKGTGVLTNVRSMQIYLNGNIDRWTSGGYADTASAQRAAADDISRVFSGDNALRNPFSNSQDVSNTFAGDVGQETDALQIIASAPEVPPKGGVVVIVPSSFNTSGITVMGYDNKSQPMVSFVIDP